MRTRIGAGGTALAAAALAASLVAPGLAIAAGTPASLKLSITGVTCNPDGVAGIRASASGSIVNANGATFRMAQLSAFEFRVIDDPAYFPFPISGSSVATWTDQTAPATRSATDARSIDTTDPSTWDTGGYTQGIWSGSRPDAWWGVSYFVITSARGIANQGSVEWYVSCPTGRVVDRATLTDLVQVSMPKP